MRTQLRALLVAMSLGLATMASAEAAIFNTTPLDMYPTTVPGAQFSFIFNTFTTGGTAFDDLWTFDISGPGAQGGGNASALSTKIIGFSINQAALPVRLKMLAWDGDGYDTVLADSGSVFAPFVQAALSQNVGGAPTHGFYALEVQGTTPVGALLTQYSGALQVAAVPEPSLYALLAGGLLFAGFKLRRHTA